MRAPVLWRNAVVLQRLTERKEWKFFGVLPAAFAIAMGVLVGVVQRGDALAFAKTPTAFRINRIACCPGPKTSSEKKPCR